MDKFLPIQDQIEMLGWALRGRVVTPRDAEYETMREVAMCNFDSHPEAIVRVANPADVAAVLNFARATDLPIAVRSGGHSVGGFSGIDGGIVIDMRDINAIELDLAAKTVWAGTGLTAGEVTRAVEQHKLIIGFGDSATVGIGGLTLGGGIGYMARKHGLTIDNLLAAEVCTAFGDIIVADKDNHPDLFWALRGGGGNFGVVTRLKFQLHDMPFFYGGALILPATPEVVAGFNALSLAAPEELTTIGIAMPCPPMPFIPAELHGQTVFFGMMAYTGEPELAEAVIAPFRALAAPIADLVGTAPYSSLYMLDPPPDVRPAVSIRSGFTGPIGIDAARVALDELATIEAPMKMAQFRVLGGAMSRVPADATAFAHRQSPVMLAFLAMHDPSPESLASYGDWATKALQAMIPDESGVYVNFLAHEGADRLRAAYPGDTWDRLREIKKRYDPENMFRRNQNVPPAE